MLKKKKEEGGPKLSLEEELAKAKGGLKKKVEVAPVEEKPRPLSFAEQIAAQRNKLKKSVMELKPPEKKVNPRDLLSQQIKLRFRNLRMHEEENESSEDSD